MSLSVAPVNNPTFTGLGNAPKQTIKGGTAITATPGSNGFIGLTQPAAVGSASTGAPDLAAIYNAAYAAAMKANPPTPVPRMVAPPNLTALYATATQQATANVTPRYTQMMNDFLASQAQALSTQQQQTTAQEGALDTTLQQNLSDSQLQRTRTAEDTATSNADTEASQAYNERTGGLSYDAASRALNTGLGASGTATSGIGQGQVGESNVAENAQSNEQLRQSTDKVTAANTLMNRTFQDLTTSDTRAEGADTSQKNQLDINLQQFIAGQGVDLTTEQHNESASKEADIATATQSDAGQLIDQWLSSLPSQGYTAQEVANAASIYKTS